MADVEDVVHGTQYLIDSGLVDPTRVAVRGVSAGGFTVLGALEACDLFTAATSVCGVADLGLLARTTHKFESRYVLGLTGATSVQDPVLAERSPINHVDRIHAPLLLIQGSEDPVVPAEQATTMYQAVRDRGLPVALKIFYGEGHGFRMATSIRGALEAELSFYCQVWDLDRSEETSKVAVENLGQ